MIGLKKRAISLESILFDLSMRKKRTPTKYHLTTPLLIILILEARVLTTL
jgi:hypothetical protein